MWCAADRPNHNYYVSHNSAKGFLDSNFIWAVFDKISNFQEIRLSRNEMWCAADRPNHNYYVSHNSAKGFLDSNFIWAVFDKISHFQEIDPNFTYSQKSYFFKYDWNFLDQLLLHFVFYGRDMQGIYFFFFFFFFFFFHFCQLWANR